MESILFNVYSELYGLPIVYTYIHIYIYIYTHTSELLISSMCSLLLKKFKLETVYLFIVSIYILLILIVSIFIGRVQLMYALRTYINKSICRKFLSKIKKTIKTFFNFR